MPVPITGLACTTNGSTGGVVTQLVPLRYLVTGGLTEVSTQVNPLYKFTEGAVALDIAGGATKNLSAVMPKLLVAAPAALLAELRPKPAT